MCTELDFMGRKETSHHSRLPPAVAEDPSLLADNVRFDKKSRTSSLDATVVTSTTYSEVDRSLLSLKDDEDVCLSDELVRSLRKSKMDVSRSAGPLSRAAAYLLRRNKRDTDMTDIREVSTQLSKASSFQFNTVDDRFASALNSCDSLQLPELRKKRASVAPIVCEETKEDDEAFLSLLLDHENQALARTSHFMAPSTSFYKKHKWSVQSRLMQLSANTGAV